MAATQESGLAALKERAGVVAALVDGRQTVLLRSPDLPPAAEDLDSPFVLYPGYSHQDPTRYAEQDRRYYHRSRAKPDSGIPIRGLADVVEEHLVATDRLADLTPYYVYTEAGLRDKYGLEDGDEVRVLVLRVHKLATPRLIDERADYRGCRTWISLSDAVSIDIDAADPVLDDATFADRRAALRTVLADA